MIVDAEVWYWTPNGMRQKGLSYATEYITRRDTERLLEEAHERGRRAGLEAASAVIRETTP